MVQRLVTDFVNTTIPSAVFNVTVKSNPIGVATSGNILIIGEADGGASLSQDVLKNNYFTPDQFDKVQQKYLSGPIVDAMLALTAPSNDTNIVGAANRIYIVKTNTSGKAQAAIASYGLLKDKNYGIGGNKYNYQITQIDAEQGPSITSDVLDFTTPAIYDGLEFTVRVNGGAAVVVTLPTGGHATAAALATQIDGLLPATLSCAVGTTANTIVISSDVDATANSKGFSKSFELIDSSAGDLAVLELSAGFTKSSVEPKIQLNVNRSDIAVSEQIVITAEVAMYIGYQGTTATMSISSTGLTTTVVGGAGSNLSLQFSNFATVKDLCDYINSQTGYSCSVVPSSTQLSAFSLDEVSSVNIATTASGQPVGIKKAVQNFINAMQQSAAVDATVTALTGIPAETSTVIYLAGGSKGGTSSASVMSAYLAAEGVDVNFVVPLFSRDASADIAENLTDSSSAYTIAAIHAGAKSHVLKMSTPKIKKHRSTILSIWDTFTVAKAASASLANARASLAFQKATQNNSAGVPTNFLPWYAAVVAAGMQAAGFYKAIVNKLANVTSYEDPSGFDSGSTGDVESALEAGLLILQQDVAGNRWVSDQTSYGLDTNFVYNSIQAMYASDLVALDLTASFQRTYVGQSLADVSASAALGFLASKMDAYKKNKLIAASDDAPLGYKNAKISIQGPVMTVSVEIKLATAIYFIPIYIQISEVSSAA
jgi:hypothetical protein